MWPSSLWCSKQRQCCGGRPRSKPHRSIEDLHDEAAYLNDQLAEINTTEGRIAFILRYATSTRQNVVQTTSFGIQSSLMLHLLHKLGGTQQIPVVWIDTGYLPAETYQFASQLSARYQLDLHVYQPHLSAARMEALYGKLWEVHDTADGDSDEAHVLYNTMRKVEPMQRALVDLDASMVLTGLRSHQTAYRQTLQFVNVDGGRLKVCPILDWRDEQVAAYFHDHRLAYHPLLAQGYRTVGDAHSSKPYDPRVHTSERDTRFHGRQQECGLHTSILQPRRVSSTTDYESLTAATSASSTSSRDSNESPAAQESPTSTVDHAADFIIYGRPSCQYCRQAKALLTGLCQEKDPTLSVATVEVGHTGVSQDDLQRMLGRSIQTVPQILYRGSYIGGFDDLLQWCQHKYPTADFHHHHVTSGITTTN